VGISFLKLTDIRFASGFEAENFFVGFNVDPSRDFQLDSILRTRAVLLPHSLVHNFLTISLMAYLITTTLNIEACSWARFCSTYIHHSIWHPVSLKISSNVSLLSSCNLSSCNFAGSPPPHPTDLKILALHPTYTSTNQSFPHTVCNFCVKIIYFYYVSIYVTSRHKWVPSVSSSLILDSPSVFISHNFGMCPVRNQSSNLIF
jgi:hypothetical protein